MKVLSSQFLISAVCAAALLGGCSSSSSTPDEGFQDDQIDAGTDTGTDTGVDTGTETETDTGAETGTDTGTETESDTGTETGVDTGTETESDTGTETGVDTGTETETDTGAETGTGTGTETETDTGTETGTDTGTETGTDTGAETGTDTGTETGTDTGAETETDTGTNTEVETDVEGPPTSGLDVLVPNVAAGSDLERLITGIRRQVSRTLLDLNQRISQGVELTDKQENCMGAFDPAVGEQLLAIDCKDALATGGVSVYVSQAAFYNTEDCHASIFDGNTDDCQLQSAGMTAQAVFGDVPEGERRPVLAYAGRDISYALTDTMLHIESSEQALAGVFKCNIDLASGSSSTPLAGTSCASIITSTADHLDEVIPQ